MLEPTDDRGFIKFESSSRTLYRAMIAGPTKNPIGIIKLVLNNQMVWYMRYFVINPRKPVEQPLKISLPSWLDSILEAKILDMSFFDEGKITSSIEVTLTALPFHPLPFPVWSIPTKHLYCQLFNQLVFTGVVLPLLLFGQIYYFKVCNAIEGVQTIGPDTIVNFENGMASCSYSSKNDLAALTNQPYLGRGEFFIVQGRISYSQQAIRAPISMFLSSVEVEQEDDEKVIFKKLAAFDDWKSSFLQSEKIQEPSYILVSDCEFFSNQTLSKIVDALKSAVLGINVVFQTTLEKTSNFLQHLLGNNAIMEREGNKADDSEESSFEYNFLREYKKLTDEEAEFQARKNLTFLDSDRITSIMPRGVTTWNDIYGYEGAKARLQRLVECLSAKNAERLSHYGLQPVKGILLHGPPGCGKSAMVQAIASSTSQPILKFTAADILSKYLGESEARLRKVFAEARKSQPCCLFIDQIEALGRRRGSQAADTTGVAERLLSTLLNEIDGIETLVGVTVIACTHHKDELDDALLRPGRLDHHVELPLPDKDDLFAIIKFTAEKLHFAYTEDLIRELCQKFLGFTTAKVLLELNKFAFDNVNKDLPLEINAIIVEE